MKSDIAEPIQQKSYSFLSSIDFSYPPLFSSPYTYLPDTPSSFRHLIPYLPNAMPSADKKPKTLYDKVVDAHIVNEQEDGTILLYIGALGLRGHVSAML